MVTVEPGQLDELLTVVAAHQPVRRPQWDPLGTHLAKVQQHRHRIGRGNLVSLAVQPHDHQPIIPGSAHLSQQIMPGLESRRRHRVLATASDAHSFCERRKTTRMGIATNFGNADDVIAPAVQPGHRRSRR